MAHVADEVRARQQRFWELKAWEAFLQGDHDSEQTFRGLADDIALGARDRDLGLDLIGDSEDDTP